MWYYLQREGEINQGLLNRCQYLKPHSAMDVYAVKKLKKVLFMLQSGPHHIMYHSPVIKNNGVRRGGIGYDISDNYYHYSGNQGSWKCGEKQPNKEHTEDPRVSSLS